MGDEVLLALFGIVFGAFDGVAKRAVTAGDDALDEVGREC